MSLVAVILLTILLVACLQYTVTKELVEVSMRKEPDVEEVAAEDGSVGAPSRSQPRNVQFLGDLQNVVGKNDKEAETAGWKGGDFQGRKIDNDLYAHDLGVSGVSTWG